MSAISISVRFRARRGMGDVFRPPNVHFRIGLRIDPVIENK